MGLESESAKSIKPTTLDKKTALPSSPLVLVVEREQKKVTKFPTPILQ